MVIKTPIGGGENKPVAKHNSGSNNQHGQRHNANCPDNYIKKETFLGADPDFHGHVFEAKHNQSEHAPNFTTVENIIKTQVGTECDRFVLKSL